MDGEPCASSCRTSTSFCCISSLYTVTSATAGCTSVPGSYEVIGDELTNGPPLQSLLILIVSWHAKKPFRLLDHPLRLCNMNGVTGALNLYQHRLA